MTHSFTHGADVNSTATAITSPDDYATLALDAIRSHRPADLEVFIRAMPDRQSFFSMHCAELAQAALGEDHGDCLTVLLKTGMGSNAELVNRIGVDGNPRQQQVLREFTDKSDMLKR